MFKMMNFYFSNLMFGAIEMYLWQYDSSEDTHGELFGLYQVKRHLFLFILSLLLSLGHVQSQ